MTVKVLFNVTHIACTNQTRRRLIKTKSTKKHCYTNEMNHILCYLLKNPNSNSVGFDIKEIEQESITAEIPYKWHLIIKYRRY